MSTNVWREKVSYFICGALCVLTVLLLSGSSGSYPVGKYQMEPIVRNSITQIYVMDTTTGRVKWVSKMNISFDEMKDD